MALKLKNTKIEKKSIFKHLGDIHSFLNALI